MAYETVNGQWPEGTECGRKIVPTDKEAITACKRLYRKIVGRPFGGRVEVTSGNRYTYIRGGVLYVNPNYRGYGGWHELVHGLSHHLARKLHGHLSSYKPHSHHHAFIERQMIEHVVKSGWLEGKLRSPTKTKAPVSLQEARAARVMARLVAKEKAMARLEKQIKKLRIKARYYEKAMKT